MGPQRPSSTHSFLSSSSSIAPNEQATAAGFAHTHTHSVSTCSVWQHCCAADGGKLLEGVPAVGLNLGVVILLRSLIPLSLVVISCFSGRDSAVKSFGGLLQRSKRKLPLHCRHPGVIGQMGQSWAQTRVYVGFTRDFFRRHSFSYVGHFLGLSLSISENSSLRWGQLKRGHTHTLALALLR